MLQNPWRCTACVYLKKPLSVQLPGVQVAGASHLSASGSTFAFLQGPTFSGKTPASDRAQWDARVGSFGMSTLLWSSSLGGMRLSALHCSLGLSWLSPPSSLLSKMSGLHCDLGLGQSCFLSPLSCTESANFPP